MSQLFVSHFNEDFGLDSDMESEWWFGLKECHGPTYI